MLHILFDCCHSGSAVELPFVYRTDEDGNINLVDNLKEGFALVGEATHLIQGGLRFDKLGEAEQLYAGATDFFKGLMHQGDSESGRGAGGDGLQQEDFEEDWVSPVSFLDRIRGMLLIIPFMMTLEHGMKQIYLLMDPKHSSHYVGLPAFVNRTLTWPTSVSRRQKRLHVQWMQRRANKC